MGHHLTPDREKLLHRVRRIRGQINAIEKAIESDEDCSSILHTIATCRGALNGLLAEVIDDHVRDHIVDPDERPKGPKADATRELLKVIRAYVK